MVIHYPAAFVAYMAYGYITYMRDRKHRIEVSVKPTDAMKAIARVKWTEKKKRKMSFLRKEEVSNSIIFSFFMPAIYLRIRTQDDRSSFFLN